MGGAQSVFEPTVGWRVAPVEKQEPGAQLVEAELVERVEIELDRGPTGNQSMLSWFFDVEHPGKAASRIIALVLATLPLIAFVIMTLRTIH